MTTYNQRAVIDNPFQGKFHKVLCVCSAGCLRSPTAALVLSQEPYNFNTRAAGTYEDIAIVPVTDTLLEWADEIVCMEEHHANSVISHLQYLHLDKPVKVLGIPDNYGYRDPVLMEFIKKAYDRVE